MTRYIIAFALLFFTANVADARPRKSAGMHPECNVTMPCMLPYSSTPEQARVARGRYITRQLGFGSPIQKRAVRARKGRPVVGIVAPLAAKVAEIQAACGSRVVSAIRHTRIAGTRRLSLHASGQAVDMVGSPACIYAQLQGYAGGYSTDYGRMGHVHISWGGPEHGLRFAHGGGRRYARHRAAKQHASAQ